MSETTVDIELRVVNGSHYESAVKVFVDIVDGMMRETSRQREIDCFKKILIPFIKSVSERHWFSDGAKKELREEIRKQFLFPDGYDDHTYLCNVQQAMDRYVDSCEDKDQAKKAIIQLSIELLD